MMERIDLAPLLKASVQTASCDLVTRSTGAAIRTRIEARIAASAYPTTHLDFSAIRLIDLSCADEVVAKLLLGIDQERPRFVMLVNVSDAHRDTIDHVLESHQLTVAAVPVETPRPCVLGWRTPDLVAAFEAVQQIGVGDAGRLADRLGWTVERAADALQSLALRRVVHAAGGIFRPLPTP